ncbi:MAG: response regulator transcription factor [Gammaproteobacteria bacterium]|nr:MAG: response regulator transcription factor [Gammaproteobacteria bacterium]
MKILVVDDEAPARDRLRRMLAELEGCTVCAEAMNGQQALDFAGVHQPDVLLLDIRMPGMDGLEVARHLLALEQPPAVIFTTAYSDHAIEAFESHAVDYLLKPVRRERLFEALKNARRLTRAQVASVHASAESAGVRQAICARVRGSLQLIPVNQIRYFQADQKYVMVCTSDTQVLVEETLKSLEQEFAGQFIRIHRNALVATDYLTGLDKDADGHYRVRMEGVDAQLEISRRHIAEVRRCIKSLQG